MAGGFGTHVFEPTTPKSFKSIFSKCLFCHFIPNNPKFYRINIDHLHNGFIVISNPSKHTEMQYHNPGSRKHARTYRIAIASFKVVPSILHLYPMRSLIWETLDFVLSALGKLGQHELCFLMPVLYIIYGFL
jgi:hypothetical protein